MMLFLFILQYTITHFYLFENHLKSHLQSEGRF